MKNLKTTYIKKVVEMFARGRYSAATETCVARWLTNGEDSEAKDEALAELWDLTLAESADGDASADAYSRWTGEDACGTRTSAVPHHRATRILRFWQSAAACLLVAVGVLGAILVTRRNETPTMMHAYCAAGDTTRVILPDGTDVLLNGATTIVYPERFTGKKREVLLMGEANFNVAKDAAHPFIVNTDEISVTALGTEFNVRAYPESEKIESTLLEGKVRVNFNGGEFVLSPAEQVVYDRTTGSATLQNPSVADVTAWQRGELVFNNRTLPEILHELEQRFSHDFVYNEAALPPDSYTFRFKRGMTLGEVMEIVADVAGNLKVTIDDTTCRVRPI